MTDELQQFIRNHPDYKENKKLLDEWLEIVTSPNQLTGFDERTVLTGLKGKRFKMFTISGKPSELEQALAPLDFTKYTSFYLAFKACDGFSLTDAHEIAWVIVGDDVEAIEWFARRWDKDFTQLFLLAAW